MKQFVFLLLLLAFMACSNISTSNPDKTVSVTIEPYRFITEAIAGDGWSVKSIVPKGASPESYDPPPSVMMDLSKSKAYIMVGGLGFEDVWKDKITNLHPNLLLVDTSEGIERQESDPHLWTSPDNMKTIAQNVCLAMCELDSGSSEGYKQRLSETLAMINYTDSIISKQLKEREGTSFLIFHPSLTYFATRYGLTQIAIEEEGKEPTLAQIKLLIDKSKEDGVGHIFVQQEFDRKNAETIAKELKAKLIDINPLNYDWQTEMLNIANSLR